MSEINVYIAQLGDRKNLAMAYNDPLTGRRVTRTTGTTSKKEAAKIAGRWEKELREGKSASIGNLTWDDFCDRYETEVLPSKAKGTQAIVATTFKHVDEIVKPERLRHVDARAISQFQAELRRRKLSERTIRTYLAHLSSALGWAQKQGMIRDVPRIVWPTRDQEGGDMKGRPITSQEFEAMLAAVPAVVGDDDAPQWTFLLRGLWASGLRLGEALGLTWEYSENISVDMTDDFPMLRIPAGAEKGNQDRLLPMAPEFAELLDEVPAKERQGSVFGIEFKTDWASRIVCRIGKTAGVVVSRKNGRTKYASAHDLRRSFGERWAELVEAHTLRDLMRHSRIETTLRYYVGKNARRTAQTLWEARGHIRGHNPLSAASASPTTPLKVVGF